MSESEEQVSKQELQQRVAEIKRLIATAVQEDYERVVRTICESKRNDRLDGYMADLVLRALDRGSQKKDDWEWRSVLACAEASFRVERWWLRFNSDKDGLDDAVFELFHSARQSFAHAINSFVYDCDDGLPLYELDTDGKLRPAQDNNEDYRFVRNMLKQDAVKDDYYSPPAWTRSLYVRESDVAAFWLFHGESDNPAAKAARAAALRMYLAGKLEIVSASTVQSVPRSEDGASKADHETKLMRVMRAAQERYYGKNFDATDPDTLPKQTDVIAWLMATYKLSKREAESIDVVLRPDTSRKR